MRQVWQFLSIFCAVWWSRITIYFFTSKWSTRFTGLRCRIVVDYPAWSWNLHMHHDEPMIWGCFKFGERLSDYDTNPKARTSPWVFYFSTSIKQFVSYHHVGKHPCLRTGFIGFWDSKRNEHIQRKKHTLFNIRSHFVWYPTKSPSIWSHPGRQPGSAEFWVYNRYAVSNEPLGKGVVSFL